MTEDKKVEVVEKVKRELSSTEKGICEKMIKKTINKKRHSEYLIKYHELMINEGLFRNYQAKLEEFKHNKKELIEELQMFQMSVAQLQDQILNGVEVKNKDDTPVGVG